MLPAVKTPVKLVVALVVVAALGIGGFFGFEYFDHRGFIKDAGRACGSLDTPTGTPTLPAGFTLPSGQTLLNVDTQGKTILVVASTAGARTDIVKVRDATLAFLVAQGFTKKGTDQEPGYEAEAQLGGRGDGSIKVRPLCKDRIEVRYTLRT
jgi:hypothetical protein